MTAPIAKDHFFETWTFKRPRWIWIPVGWTATLLFVALVAYVIGLMGVNDMIPVIPGMAAMTFVACAAIYTVIFAIWFLFRRETRFGSRAAFIWPAFGLAVGAMVIVSLALLVLLMIDGNLFDGGSSKAFGFAMSIWIVANLIAAIVGLPLAWFCIWMFSVFALEKTE